MKFIKKPARRWSRRLSLAVASAITLTSFDAAAVTPRDDMRGAYDEALRLFNDLELDSALEIVEAGIVAARSADHTNDPYIASLYLIKGALLYSNNGDDSAAEIMAAMSAAVTRNYYVVVPVEVRSEELMVYLEEARELVGERPEEAIDHTTPSADCGEDIEFEALLGVPDGGQAILYWRRQGDNEFASSSMDTFSNVASVAVSASEHGDRDIEYFIYAFDSSDQDVANFGSTDDPMQLDLGCVNDLPPELDKVVLEKPIEPVYVPSKAADGFKRVAINLGIGTGFGYAREGMTVENTYSQFFPASVDYDYSYEQHSCAIARWYGAGSLPSGTDLYGGNAAEPTPTSIFSVWGPEGRASDLAQAYNPTTCAERHPVASGFASSPMIISPELQFKISDNLSLGVFARLQLFTGSQVIRDDPSKQTGDPDPKNFTPGTSWWDDVYSANPVSNYQESLPFTWAAGLNLRYFLGKPSDKFRLYTGGFFSYGSSRLKINMGFANDRNGNSVPDDFEAAVDQPGGPSSSSCFEVWPYNHACDPTSNFGSQEIVFANSINAHKNNIERKDTVVLGPVGFGGLFGFHYQVAKRLALFSELQVGGWFPNGGTVLFDLKLGPAITF